VSRNGASGSENAGMSNEIPMRIRNAECPRFPQQRSSAEGKSALSPVPYNAGVGDGQQVDIPVPGNKAFESREGQNRII
jgi:hypothetical protein